MLILVMMSIQHFGRDPGGYITWVVLVTFSICVHELCHVWCAMSQGDRTAYQQGYLTLNPLKLMGAQGILLLLFVGIAFGAVPINPQALKRRYSRALVAVSGPGANLLLACIFCMLDVMVRRFATSSPLSESFVQVFRTGALINCLLFVFNMLPIPMLDGWELYSLLVPGLHSLCRGKAEVVGLIAIVVLFFTGAGVFVFRAAAVMAGTMITVADGLARTVFG